MSWLIGDRGGLVEATGSALELAVERRAPWLVGELASWRARVGVRDQVDRASAPFALQLAGEWARAAGQWHDLGCPYESALALAETDDEDALRRALDICRQRTTWRRAGTSQAAGDAPGRGRLRQRDRPGRRAFRPPAGSR